MSAQQGGTYAVIDEQYCIDVNQMGQTISNLKLLKENLNLFHQVNDTQPFYRTDVFPGWEDWFKRLWGNGFSFVLCLFVHCLSNLHSFFPFADLLPLTC